jgi:hypothetical protein
MYIPCVGFNLILSLLGQWISGFWNGSLHDPGTHRTISRASHWPKTWHIVYLMTFFDKWQLLYIWFSCTFPLMCLIPGTPTTPGSAGSYGTVTRSTSFSIKQQFGHMRNASSASLQIPNSPDEEVEGILHNRFGSERNTAGKQSSRNSTTGMGNVPVQGLGGRVPPKKVRCTWQKCCIYKIIVTTHNLLWVDLTESILSRIKMNLWGS